MKKVIKWIVAILIIIIVVLGIGMMTINMHVQRAVRDNIVTSFDTSYNMLSPEDLSTLKEQKPDCIMVLGCGISDAETPSPMLKDRLDAGIALYRAGAAPKILLTGDNGTERHNEIHVMLKYTLAAGVPAEDIFCDHAGFSTFDSAYRLKSIFDVDSVIVVTQSYHIYRALYLCEKLGINAVGVASDQEKYSGQAMRELREVVARNKDFFKVKTKATATYGGDKFPISGSGVGTHGE